MNHNKATINKNELRKFGMLIGGLIAGIWGILQPWRHGGGYPAWPWIVFGILGVWSLLIPRTLNPVYKVWMNIGHRLGMINSKIILGLLFYAVFTPFGIVRRLCGKDTMGKCFTNDKSYRVTSTNHSVKQMDRPF